MIHIYLKCFVECAVKYKTAAYSYWQRITGKTALLFLKDGPVSSYQNMFAVYTQHSTIISVEKKAQLIFMRYTEKYIEQKEKHVISFCI